MMTMILDQSATKKVVFMKLPGVRPDEEVEILYSFSVERTVDMPSDMVDCATMQFDKDLMELLTPVIEQKWFISKFQGSVALNDMIADLHRVAQEANEQRGRLQRQGKEIAHADSIAERAGIIIGQVAQVGWRNIHDIAEDMSSVVMKTKDARGREHRFSVCIDDNFPISMPLVNVDLPTPIHVHWVEGTSEMNLGIVLEKVQEQIDKCTPLFDVLSDIDDNCVVLEPLKRCFAVTKRRILIEKTCSLMLNINSESPLALCDMYFMGPPAKVRALQKTMSENLHLWGSVDACRLLRGRLEALLGLSLPSPTYSKDHKKRGRVDPREEQGERVMECGICYNFALREKREGEREVDDMGLAVAPDQICSNDLCQRVYHYRCLHDWLITVPSSRSSFGSLFGHCPYCSEWLCVKVGTTT